MTKSINSSMLAIVAMLLSSICFGEINAFVHNNNNIINNKGSSLLSSSSSTTTTTTTTLKISKEDKTNDDATTNRRSFLTAGLMSALGGIATMVPKPVMATEYRQGIEVTAFNGLIFNYRGGDFNGLDATTIDEPTVSYAEFYQRMEKNEVAFVEFLAPDGDVAYVTFKPSSSDGKEAQPSVPIRIGEGYPIEKHDGYSSPMFCVRAVKNFGVPYKFTVPGLAKFQ